MNRSKRLNTVSYLKVALLVEHLELIELLILVFLLSDVVADRFFIQPCRCHIVAPGPKILADEVFSPSARTGDPYGALPLDVAYNLGDGILGGIDMSMCT